MPARPLRVVLDTNVLVSALLFSGGSLARLRVAWQRSTFIPLASTATARELVRVLAYPKLRLDSAAQQELIADYLPWATVVTVPEPPPPAPVCRDPLDLPFLHLAAAGKANVLVSGDAHRLALAAGKKQPALRFEIMSPADFLRRIEPRAS